MKKNIFLILLFLIFLVLVDTPSWTEQKGDDSSLPSGQISLPWDKFQKLLNLDRDEITLDIDEFALIVRQTEPTDLPPFLVKEGKVVIKRTDFKNLLEAMKPPVADTSIGNFLVTSADYQAKVEKDSTVVTANFNIEVLPRKGRKDFLLVPLVKKEIALKRLSLDGKPALITGKDNYHAVAVADEGSHIATAVFVLATDLTKGPQSLTFPVPKTPITLLSIEIPQPSIQPEIVSATSVKRRAEGKNTIIEAVLSPTEAIQVAWSRVIPEAEKGPPKIYADLWQLLSIEDDALRVNATASVNVLQNTVTGLTFLIPDNYQILDVDGGVVGDWKEKDLKGQKMLDVSLKTPRQGAFSFSLRAERIFAEKTNVADYNGFALPQAVREKGFIAVEMKSSAEAKVQEAEGLDRASFAELPPQLVSLSQKPLIFAYKYLRHPYRMVLDIERHKELPVVTTVVDNASGVTLFTEDGKIVHQLTYTVRNTWKQFMEVALPKSSQLWGTFVNGQSVKPTRNEGGKLLIPLNRSQSSEGGLAPFEVELIYFEKGGKFWWFGKKKSSFATPDLMMSRAIWSVYLPFDYSFIHFGGTMEKEKIASGIRPLLGLSKRVVDYDSLSKEIPVSAPDESQVVRGGREIVRGMKRDDGDMSSREKPQVGMSGSAQVFQGKPPGLDRSSMRGSGALSLLEKNKDLKSYFGKNLPLSESEVAQQFTNEMKFAQRGDRFAVGVAGGGGMEAGTMPIRVQVPTIGQVYRFAKQIVSEEPLTVSFTYVYDTPFTVVKIVILILILFILYRQRNWFKKNWDLFSTWYNKKKLDRFVTPTSLVIVSAVLFLFSWFFLSPIFTKTSLLLFILALIYYFVLYFRTKKGKKKQPEQSNE